MIADLCRQRKTLTAERAAHVNRIKGSRCGRIDEGGFKN